MEKEKEKKIQIYQKEKQKRRGKDGQWQKKSCMQSVMVKTT